MRIIHVKSLKGKDVGKPVRVHCVNLSIENLIPYFSPNVCPLLILLTSESDSIAQWFFGFVSNMIGLIIDQTIIEIT